MLFYFRKVNELLHKQQRIYVLFVEMVPLLQILFVTDLPEGFDDEQNETLIKMNPVNMIHGIRDAPTISYKHFKVFENIWILYVSINSGFNGRKFNEPHFYIRFSA